MNPTATIYQFIETCVADPNVLNTDPDLDHLENSDLDPKFEENLKKFFYICIFIHQCFASNYLSF